MNESQSQDTPELRSYLWPIWRRKWLVVAAAVIAAVGTYVISSAQTKQYQASTQVYIQQADPTVSATSSGGAGPPTAQSLQDIATLFTSQSVTNAVYRQLHLPYGAAGSVSVTPESGSSFIRVTAVSPSRALAARLANAYVSAFLTARRTQVVTQARQAQRADQATLLTLHPGDINATGERQTLLSQIANLQSEQLNPSTGAQQIDTAVPPAAASSPRPLRDAAFGGAVGLVLGLLIVFGLEMFDNRLISVEAIERIFGRPVLTVLPHVADTAPKVSGSPSMTPEFVEATRMLRVQVRMATRDRGARTVLVTSSLPGEGKSTVARSLGLTYAEAGERVLVIDADLRRPTIEDAFAVKSELGLVQLLQSGIPLSEATVAVQPRDEPRANGAGAHQAVAGSIDVLAHGNDVADPVTLLSSPSMKALLDSASESYDTVIIDTPPLLVVSDVIPLLEMADIALLVVRLGKSTHNTAGRCADMIQRIPELQLTGVVVNDMRRGFGSPEYDAYRPYGYGGYGSGPTREPSKSSV